MGISTDFQLSLLCYLVQSTDGKSYVSHINETIFDTAELKLSIQVLKRYHKNHKETLPGRLQYAEFLEKEIKATGDNISDQQANELRGIAEDLYVPLSDADMQYISDEFAHTIQQQEIDSTIKDYAKGTIDEKDLLSSMNRISSISEEEDEETYKDSGFLIADRDKHYSEQVEGAPTFLHDLNKLTAAKGFYSPQLIVFMSAPKHFKTGLLIKTAVEYTRDGYKVYYADGENGAMSIRNRSKMAIMECELGELFKPGIQKELDKTMAWFGKSMGGELFIDSFPANTKCLNDVDARLTYLKKEFGFEPDLIVYDSLEHFIPNSDTDRRRDIRIQIQRVYHESVALNKKRGTFSFTPSQVNKAAVDKKVFTMKDIAEDFGKVMNAHAIFAICATEEEKEEGIRRIIPVVQREGEKFKGYNMCMIKVDESKMMIQEVDQAELLADVEDD